MYEHIFERFSEFHMNHNQNLHTSAVISEDSPKLPVKTKAWMNPLISESNMALAGRLSQFLW